MALRHLSTARVRRWFAAAALIVVPSLAAAQQPESLPADDLKLWNQFLPRCARYYAEVGGELYANLKYDRAAQSSGALGKSVSENRREVKLRLGDELLQLKSRPIGTSATTITTPRVTPGGTGVVKRQPVEYLYTFELPAEEATHRRTALPRFALHEFGRIHSARIDKIAGPEEMVLGDVWLFDRPAYAAAKAREIAGAQAWASAEREKLTLYARKRNVDRHYFENDDTQSILRAPTLEDLVKLRRDAVEWQFATRTQLDAEQSKLTGARLRVRGVPTAGLRAGERWSGAKDTLALAARQGNDWTAVPVKSFNGNVDPKRLAAHLESRKISPADFVALARRTLQSQEPRLPEARVVAAIELPAPPPLLDGTYTATLSDGWKFLHRVTGNQLVREQQTDPATGQPATPPGPPQARTLTITRRSDGSCTWTLPDGTFEVWTPTEGGEVHVARWKRGDNRQGPPTTTGTAKRNG